MDSFLTCNVCRLCLNKSESLINIFEEKGRHGYVASEVIRDLLQFEVCKADGHPQGVCYICLDKLTDFKIFKDQCICSKVIYDNEFPRKIALLEDKSYPNSVNPVKLETEEITIEDDDDNAASLNPIKLKREDIIIEDDSMVKLEQEEITIDEGNSNMVKLEQEEITVDVDNNNMENFRPIQLKQELGIFYQDTQSQDIAVVKETPNISQTADKILCSTPPEGEPDLHSGEKSKVHVDIPQNKDATQASDTSKTVHSILYSLLVGGQIDSRMNGKRIQEKLPKPAENTAEGLLTRPSHPPPVEILNLTSAHDCHPKTKNRSTEVVEEYVAVGIEADGTSENPFQSSRQYQIKLTILRRSSDGEYLGELHVNKDYMKSSKNAVSCRFSLGTRSDANCYIQQFRKTFTGMGPKSVQISHRLPGQKAGILCNLGTRERKRTTTVSMPAVASNGSSSIPAQGINLANIGSQGLGLADILSLNILAFGSADRASGKRPVTTEVPVTNSRSRPPSNDGEHPNCSKGSSGGKEFMCEECGKVFIYRSWLSMHHKIHTGKKSFPCDFCDKTFIHRAGLVQHLNLHDVEKPFKCSVCGLSFNRKYFLIDHQRKHNSKKTFDCESCNKRFVSQYYLHCHQKCHSSNKNFECNVCGSKFTSREDLKSHLMIHRGERPFKCDVCGKTFRRKAVLISHVHTHIREKLFSCHVCMRHFKQKCSLKNHMKVHH